MILSIQKKLRTFRRRDPSLRCEFLVVVEAAMLSLEFPTTYARIDFRYYMRARAHSISGRDLYLCTYNIRTCIVQRTHPRIICMA